MALKVTSVLAVGAHPDDIELGCGGSLCKAIESGAKVTVVYMTKGELSGDKNIRTKESEKALSVLGATSVYFGDFPDANIPNCHESIEFLERFSTKSNPTVVMSHSVNDTHQDHRAVAWLSISAFREVPIILSFESPRSTSAFSPSYFVDISDSLDRKWAALKCLKSQYSKRYMSYESMINLAKFRGTQVGVKAAEAFEVVRYLEYKW